MNMKLIVQGNALPTFLLDAMRIATGASSINYAPPQVTEFSGRRTPGI